VERGGPGIYHVTNRGYWCWFGSAEEIIQQAGLSQVKISPVPTSALGRRALRPRNSWLANSRLETEGLGHLRRWQDALRRYLLREGRAKT